MTDAERWRHIAETKAWGICGLCLALHLELPSEGRDFGQYRRMGSALGLLHPGFWHTKAYWWPTNGRGDTERTYACLLLAAMAEADGGNHKETTA